MSDISLVWDVQNARGDWAIQPPDLLDGNDLATAVLISLFSDRTALPGDTIPDGTTDPRGWWGDDPTHPLGSRLWLIERAKQTAGVLNAVQDYITEALQWLIDDGVAVGVDITVQWVRPGVLGAQIIVRHSNGTSTAMKFSWAWASTQ